MRKSDIVERVRRFLESDETDSELAREYLRLLLDEWRSNAKEIKRNLVVMAVLVIAFVLFSQQAVQEVSMAGIKIGNFGLIVALIPVLIAGALLRAILRDIDEALFHVIYFELTKQAFPGLYESDLDEVIMPSSMPFTHHGRSVMNESLLAKLQDAAKRGEEVLFLVLIPLGFSAYAYVQLFTNSRAPVAVVWISLVVTVTLLALAAVLASLKSVEFNRDFAPHQR